MNYSMGDYTLENSYASQAKNVADAGQTAGAATMLASPVVGAGIMAVSGLISAREQRKQAERDMAIKLALEQRQQQLSALQNTQREYDTAYGNMMNVASQSLKYR